jgi:hypothetical protein
MKTNSYVSHFPPTSDPNFTAKKPNSYVDHLPPTTVIKVKSYVDHFPPPIWRP